MPGDRARASLCCSNLEFNALLSYELVVPATSSWHR
jgi:hypothetical protein